MKTENTENKLKSENEILDEGINIPLKGDSIAESTDTRVEEPTDGGHEQTIEATTENYQQIKLESSKTTLARRPWKLGAVEIPTTRPDGKQVKVWVAAVIDDSGHAICCGDTVDMEFIIKMENSYDNILKLMNASGTAISDAVDVLQDFECKKTKAFKFN